MPGAMTMAKLGSGHAPTSLKKNGIHHVGLKVSNAEGSRRFYCEILGLVGHLREPGIVFASSGRDMLVLYEEDKGGTDFHFGFNVGSAAAVDRWKDWLVQHRLPIAEDVAEDKFRSIKFQDPDGHWIEISHET
jgi:catechol 2,3-dioxygenase-like lactoylglutathione lyase family enzyme